MSSPLLCFRSALVAAATLAAASVAFAQPVAPVQLTLNENPFGPSPRAPYDNWVRITIGLPEENARAQAALRRIVR